MSIQERSPGVFRLRVSAGIDPVDGRKRFISEEVHGSRRKAEQRQEDLKAEVKRSQRDRTSMTLRATISEWRSQAGHARGTRRNYDLAVRAMPAKFLSTPIDKLNATIIRELYARVTDEFGIHRTRQVHAVTSGALTFAWQQDWIRENPARRVKPPAQRRRKASLPSRLQVRALLALVAERPDLHVWVMLAVILGARPSELLALHWSDINLDGQEVSIDKALEPIGTPDEKPTKTEDERVVAFGAVTEALLRKWRVAFLERAIAVGAKPVEDPYVFTDASDGATPWKPTTASKRFTKLKRQVGVECRMYDLRHFDASELLAAGFPVKVVGDRLGHKRGATTTDTYGHPTAASDRAAAQHLEDIVS